MSKLWKAPLIGLLLTALIAAPLAATALAGGKNYIEAEETEGGPMIYDTVIVRPLSLVATLAGSAVWLVSLPFSALGGNVDKATEKLVKEPFQYTFQRPLGEF